MRRCCPLLVYFDITYLEKILMCHLHSRVQLRDPLDRNRQAPLSMGFSRQESWSGGHAFLQGIFQTQE